MNRAWSQQFRINEVLLYKVLSSKFHQNFACIIHYRLLCSVSVLWQILAKYSKYFVEMPFGRAPVLEVDGTKIAGSMNILRYLGITFGKYIPINFVIIIINFVKVLINDNSIIIVS